MGLDHFLLLFGCLHLSPLFLSLFFCLFLAFLSSPPPPTLARPSLCLFSPCSLGLFPLETVCPSIFVCLYLSTLSLPTRLAVCLQLLCLFPSVSFYLSVSKLLCLWLSCSLSLCLCLCLSAPCDPVRIFVLRVCLSLGLSFPSSLFPSSVKCTQKGTAAPWAWGHPLLGCQGAGAWEGLWAHYPNGVCGGHPAGPGNGPLKPIGADSSLRPLFPCCFQAES